MTEEIAMDKLRISEYEKKPLKDVTIKDKNKKLEIFGWVQTSRQMGKKGLFIDLFAHYQTIKCVYFLEEGVTQSLTPWSTVTVFGEVKENYTKDKFEFEFHVERIIIHSIAPSFPINKDTQSFQKLEQGHLYMRTPERMLFLQARSFLMRCFRDFFFSKDCTEVSPPTFVGTQVEGGSTLFKLDYFGREAFLTQSSQLYLESVVPVCMKTFCMVNSYRAEKSHTTRHLTEYLHVEAEFADIQFDCLLDFIEEMVHTVSKRFYEKFGDKIKEIYGEDFKFHSFERPFKRIQYKDAIEFLRSTGYTKETGIPFELGDDIPDAAELYICQKYADGTPVFLTHFLTAHKPFYMKLAEDKKYTESVDLLWPGLGEVVGGSMRKQHKQEIVEALKEEGLNLDDYTFYLDLAEYGSHSKGGFGLGFERLLASLMRYKNVTSACLYPRFVTRCTP